MNIYRKHQTSIPPRPLAWDLHEALRNFHSGQPRCAIYAFFCRWNPRGPAGPGRVRRFCHRPGPEGQIERAVDAGALRDRSGRSSLDWPAGDPSRRDQDGEKLDGRHQTASLQAINVGVSPDGALAATSGYDGMIRIWDLATGKFVLLPCRARLSFVRRRLVARRDDAGDHRRLRRRSARLESPNGDDPARIERAQGSDWSVGRSPNGRYLVVTGGSSGFATFWDVEKNKQLKTVEHGTGVYGVAWSPDGKMVGAASVRLLSLGRHHLRQHPHDETGWHRGLRGGLFRRQQAADDRRGCRIAMSGEVEEGKKLQTIAGIANICFLFCPTGNMLPSSRPVARALFDAEDRCKPTKTLPVNAGRHQVGPTDGKTLSAYTTTNCVAFDMVAGPDQTVDHRGGFVGPRSPWTPGKPIITDLGEEHR